MKIDRHNYEEYFILYMDNELGSADRRMVEDFVLLHPDLKEELDLLLQYKLSPDTAILFQGKEDLLKVNGETPVSFSNYEEWFILYTDNELNAEQRKAVEDFIAINPILQKEMAILHQTKLQPESVIFTDKKSLYRKEGKVRSLPFGWWRVAAAVLLFLGLSITAVLVINSRKAGNNEIVKGTEPRPIQNKEPDVITPIIKEITPENKNAVADLVQQEAAPVVNKHEILAANNKKTIARKDLIENSPSSEKNRDQVIAATDKNKPSNNLPQPVNNPNLIKINPTNDIITNITPPNEITNPEKALTNAVVTNPKEETSPTKNPGIQFAKLEENGENKKSRGFFRKLVRTFEKRTDIDATDDGKLLVGGFSINVK